MSLTKACLLAALALSLFACNDAPSEKKATAPDSSSVSTKYDWALLPFTKVDSVNPVLTPGTGTFTCPVRKQVLRWENKDVFNPAMVVKNGKVYMLYRAEDTIGKHAGTSRIGLAESTDGLHFTRHPAPVLYPDNDAQKKYEWEGGCEDPRIVQDSAGTYYMTYTAYDGKTARLMVASSKDLLHWTKHGPAFAKAFQGKYLNKWSKSGSIVSKFEGGTITAVKIKGKYWMYWGDRNVWAANSDDLIDWTPVLYEAGQKSDVELRYYAKEIPEVKTVFGPRPGKFDDDLVEPGPPAMLTGQGILLLYNGRRESDGAYSAGQLLIDKNDPTKVLQRMDDYFMTPDKPYEITGQVNKVCFIEGLVQFNKQWFLYYGTADSKIAVASLHVD